MRPASAHGVFAKPFPGRRIAYAIERLGVLQSDFIKRVWLLFEEFKFYVNRKSVGPQAAQVAELQDQGASAGRLSAEARRVHSRLYHYAEKAELGAA